MINNQNFNYNCNPMTLTYQPIHSTILTQTTLPTTTLNPNKLRMKEIIKSRIQAKYYAKYIQGIPPKKAQRSIKRPQDSKESLLKRCLDNHIQLPPKPQPVIPLSLNHSWSMDLNWINSVHTNNTNELMISGQSNESWSNSLPLVNTMTDPLNNYNLDFISNPSQSDLSFNPFYFSTV